MNRRRFNLGRSTLTIEVLHIGVLHWEVRTSRDFGTWGDNRRRRFLTAAWARAHFRHLCGLYGALEVLWASVARA